MDLHAYLLFLGSVVVLCVVPGPDMAYLLTRTLTQGRKAGVVAALGINAGGYVHVLAVVLGLSALLAASSVAFTVLKWVGAVYLVWIGLRQLASQSALSISGAAAPVASHARIFCEGFLSDTLNPKVALFFLALLPQFVTTEATLGVTAQLLVLGVSCNVFALAINLVFVCFASAATQTLRRRTSWMAWLNRIAGTVFIALGVRLARERL